MTMGAEDIAACVPVTFERCNHVEGPFFHGTKTAVDVGAHLAPGEGSDYQQGRTSNHIYFCAILETAAWGAELATSLAGSGERGHIYVVEPTGPFEDDPNVTNKKFPGNITQSYRTRHPLQTVGEVQTWQGHTPEVLNAMLENIARLREQGLDVIEDRTRQRRSQRHVPTRATTAPRPSEEAFAIRVKRDYRVRCLGRYRVAWRTNRW